MDVSARTKGAVSYGLGADISLPHCFVVRQVIGLSSKTISAGLKDPSQPPPFSMPSKLLTLHGEAKSYCFTVSRVPESMFHYLK